VKTNLHEPSDYPQFNKAALTVVSSMKFRPAQYEGEPVGVWMLQKVDFNTR